MCWEDIKTGRKLRWDAKQITADTNVTYQKLFDPDRRRVGLLIGVNGTFSTSAGSMVNLVANTSTIDACLASITVQYPSRRVDVMHVGQIITEEIGYIGVTVGAKTFTVIQILTTQELEDDHK